MEKLYYKDRNIKEFIANIEEVKEINNTFHVCLDKTAFFPGGGGQPYDLGLLGGQEIIEVYEEEGKVYHIIKKLPKVNKSIKCIVDWERRRDGMEQHLGQHVISGAFFSLFNANTVSFHMGKESSTVDIQGDLDEDKIKEAERYANEVINKNIDVELLIPSKKELKKLKIRRDLPKTDGEITIIRIGDLDINACCGVHPYSTLELRLIKLTKWEKHKGATRIEFLAGSRAIKDSTKKDILLKELSNLLKCGNGDLINTINNIREDVRTTQNENKNLKIELSDYKIKEMLEEADKIRDISIIKKFYDSGDVKYISKLAEKITENENVIVLYSIKNEDKANLIFAASKNINISMNEILKDSITLIDGKGGGSKFFAQGGGKNVNNINSTIDYAEMKIKSILNT